MNPLHPTIAGRARHRCEYCRAPEVIFNFLFEVEHIIPLSRGGTDDSGNLALSCRACNAHKAAHLTAYDEVTQQQVRLFRPRLDNWQENFAVEQVSGAILGLTAIGRATVTRLQFNTRTQQNARWHWLR